VIRAVASGFALSLAFALAASGSFLLWYAVLQPDRWWDRGIGWLAVLAASIATVAAGFTLVMRAIERHERDAYIRANRRD
jgi:drug/metabolite transporter (DMT)-like permease